MDSELSLQKLEHKYLECEAELRASILVRQSLERENLYLREIINSLIVTDYHAGRN